MKPGEDGMAGWVGEWADRHGREGLKGYIGVTSWGIAGQGETTALMGKGGTVGSLKKHNGAG